MKLKLSLHTIENIETTCQSPDFADVFDAVSKTLFERNLVIKSIKQETFAGEIEVVVNAIKKQ